MHNTAWYCTTQHYSYLHFTKLQCTVFKSKCHAVLCTTIYDAALWLFIYTGFKHHIALFHNTLHSQLYTVYYTQYIVHFTHYTVNYTQYTVHYTQYTVNYTQYTGHYSPYIIHSTLYMVHSSYTQYTVHYKQYTEHNKLNTVACPYL